MKNVEPLSNLLLEVVKRSVFGWDCIIPGLVQLGTFLMDVKSIKTGITL